jgi:DNA-binding MurR/RpiR family transcriptional regulator
MKDLLGDAMAAHTGTNDNFTAEQFDEMVRALKDVHRVVFVNVKASRTSEHPASEYSSLTLSPPS